MKPKNRFNKDGSCPGCAILGGWLCKDCQSDNAANERATSANLRLVIAGIRENEIARVCARYELESDEFQTREQKALAYIAYAP